MENSEIIISLVFSGIAFLVGTLITYALVRWKYPRWEGFDGGKDRIENEFSRYVFGITELILASVIVAGTLINLFIVNLFLIPPSGVWDKVIFDLIGFVVPLVIAVPLTIIFLTTNRNIQRRFGENHVPRHVDINSNGIDINFYGHEIYTFSRNDVAEIKRTRRVLTHLFPRYDFLKVKFGSKWSFRNNKLIKVPSLAGDGIELMIRKGDLRRIEAHLSD
jgi:hypothetical protein